jgi:two-component system OmpR family response regulator
VGSDTSDFPHEPSADASNLSIYCIDHDTDVLLITQLALQLDGRIVAASASNGRDALVQLLAPTFRPDCILLDRAMPDVDGRLLLGEIRSIPHHRETPVIFLTGHVMPGELNDYAALGASGTIMKPFDPLSLASQIRGILAVIATATCVNGK